MIAHVIKGHGKEREREIESGERKKRFQMITETIVYVSGFFTCKMQQAEVCNM